ncbi:MAG: transcription factor S [Nanoarchaeota archaeon]|nr:transcription factor S [Nanoarchaeota archaeon]
MEFCEKCGGIIKVEGDKAACASCGVKAKKRPKIEASEKINQQEKIEVIKEGSDNVYPLIAIECLKCGHKRGYFWTTQTRASDEPETKFFKCEKCKYTWRKYR